MKLHDTYFSTPSAAPTFSDNTGSQYEFRCRRLRTDGRYSAVSPTSVGRTLPNVVTPEDWVGKKEELAEDQILVTEAGQNAWRLVPRPSNDKIGPFAVPAFSTSWTVISDFEDNQIQNFQLDAAPILGTPDTLNLSVENDDPTATLNDLIFSIVDEQSLTQAALSGLVTFSYLGSYATTGDGTLSGTPINVTWQVDGLNYNLLPIDLPPNQVAFVEIVVTGQSSHAPSFPSNLKISSSIRLVPNTISPAFQARSFMLDEYYQLYFPLLSGTGGDITLARCFVNTGGGSAAVNPTAFTKTLADGDYRAYVTQQGVFGFELTSVALVFSTIELATFTVSTGDISNIEYKIGAANSSYIERPTLLDASVLKIGRAVKLETGTGNVILSDQSSDLAFGAVAKLPTNGLVGVVTKGLAIFQAFEGITGGTPLSPNMEGKWGNAGETPSAISYTGGGTNEYFTAEMAPVTSGGITVSGGLGQPQTLPPSYITLPVGEIPTGISGATVDTTQSGISYKKLDQEALIHFDLRLSSDGTQVFNVQPIIDAVVANGGLTLDYGLWAPGNSAPNKTGQFLGSVFLQHETAGSVVGSTASGVGLVRLLNGVADATGVRSTETANSGVDQGNERWRFDTDIPRAYVAGDRYFGTITVPIADRVPTGSFGPWVPVDLSTTTPPLGGSWAYYTDDRSKALYRIGPSQLEIDVALEISSSGGSGDIIDVRQFALQFAVLANLTIDETKYPIRNTTGSQIIFPDNTDCGSYDVSGDDFNAGSVYIAIENNVSTGYFLREGTASGTGQNAGAAWKGDVPFNWATGDWLTFKFAMRTL